MAENTPDGARRPAKRREKKEPIDWAKKTVGLDASTHTSLVKSAEKLSMSKTKFASAAIRYFVENGLDPTKTGVSEIAQLRTLIGESNYEIRKQNVDIGNRLVAILRTWEANQYKFMQKQQVNILDYLEDIETNILNHQVAVESQVLAPIFERLVRNGIDAHLTRMLTEVLMLKTKDAKYLPEELKTSTANYDAQRDRKLILELQKILETAAVSVPKRTQKPTLAVPIVGNSAKPTGPPTPTGTAPPAPKS